MGRFEGDDYDGEDANLRYGRWIAREKAVLKGRPAQQGFRELIAALVATATGGRLGCNTLCNEAGDVCAVGAMAYHRLVQEGKTPEEALLILRDHALDDAYDGHGTAEYGRDTLGLTYTLAWIIGEQNDERYYALTPEQRHGAMLRWAREHLRETA